MCSGWLILSILKLFTFHYKGFFLWEGLTPLQFVAGLWYWAGEIPEATVVPEKRESVLPGLWRIKKCCLPDSCWLKSGWHPHVSGLPPLHRWLKCSWNIILQPSIFNEFKTWAWRSQLPAKQGEEIFTPAPFIVTFICDRAPKFLCNISIVTRKSLCNSWNIFEVTK